MENADEPGRKSGFREQSGAEELGSNFLRINSGEPNKSVEERSARGLPTPARTMTETLGTLNTSGSSGTTESAIPTLTSGL
jgi:hypothetical protein